ncbi:hypothetical protein CR205_14195 [Alteribacter lacisalsi]|uniref:Uncharacterized protein n=1 Tax=Alteribacter lacisalsi TaxID=2045244 RepID=A0A2W0H7V8_9BACI|nr:hypothetical protein [Alteribacter lacisalsi]PYZ96826.1 hypothetical protein CR205_14195 [Alteribacter lacisalsi]
MKSMIGILAFFSVIVLSACGGENPEAEAEHRSFEDVKQENFPFEEANEFTGMMSEDIDRSELIAKHGQVMELAEQAYQDMEQQQYETPEMEEVHTLYLESLSSMITAFSALEGEMEDSLSDDVLQTFMENQENAIRYWMDSYLTAQEEIYGDEDAEAEVQDILDRLSGS